MKKMNKKGFTLMEMLIVVAIIGILVAIAIPTFSSSLDKSRKAADQANVRAAYAEAVANSLTSDESKGSATTATTQAAGSINISGVSGSWNKGATVTVSVDGSVITISGVGGSAS